MGGRGGGARVARRACARAALPDRGARLARARARPLARDRHAAHRALPRERSSGVRVPGLLALIAAAALAGWLRAGFEREPRDGRAAFAVDVLLRYRRQTRLVLFALAAVLAVEAASLTLLELVPSWDRGHVAVTGLWGATAVGAVLAGLRATGAAWAAATALLSVGYDVNFVAGDGCWCSLAVAAAAALIVALLYERRLGPVAATGAVLGAALAVGASLGIAGHDRAWLLVLAVAVIYAGLGAAFLAARRNPPLRCSRASRTGWTSPRCRCSASRSPSCSKPSRPRATSSTRSAIPARACRQRSGSSQPPSSTRCSAPATASS